MSGETHAIKSQVQVRLTVDITSHFMFQGNWKKWSWKNRNGRHLKKKKKMVELMAGYILTYSSLQS